MVPPTSATGECFAGSGREIIGDHDAGTIGIVITVVPFSKIPVSSLTTLASTNHHHMRSATTPSSSAIFTPRSRLHMPKARLY